MSRQEVVDKLKQGSTFITIYQKDGKWYSGKSVSLFRGRFIKMNPNDKLIDNLEFHS
ncbi:hypothetical protein M3M39_05765 [Fructilactobacillus hinvesii]|uniref:Uncharacterized protein n=1 Tax=Fructilactobacillus hinvesii TaxID=2940300 RepID=A0ABY5BRE8_9LACO|nr:hypothetical protein [Fructilactobacillus hinvesii]USS87627.1 hypothetical protein M3M39_05765 [Fructilactobacillus hinvesii]